MNKRNFNTSFSGTAKLLLFLCLFLSVLAVCVFPNYSGAAIISKGMQGLQDGSGNISNIRTSGLLDSPTSTWLHTDQTCPLFPDSMPSSDRLETLTNLSLSYEKINEKWNEIFASSNATNETRKIGTTIRVALTPLEPTQLNLPCLNTRSYELLKGLPQNESQELIRDVTERIPITSFDNQTERILKKLSPNTRAELTYAAIEAGNSSSWSIRNQTEPIKPTARLGENYIIQFVATEQGDCQAIKDLPNATDLSPVAIQDICSLSSSDQKELSEVVAQPGFALPVNTLFYEMGEIINIVTNNNTYMESLDEQEYEALGNVIIKPSPKNTVLFLTKAHPKQVVGFIMMFYPENIQSIFSRFEAEEKNNIVNRISQVVDAQVLNNIKSVKSVI